MKDIKAKETVEEARERVVESVAQNMDLYGVAPAAGRLYATLYFVDHPMTLDDLSEAVQMSKTSMSTGVRALMDLNMVEKVWQKGVRKDLYQVKDDWYQNFIDLFCIQWRKGLSLNMEALHRSTVELEEALEDNPSEDVKQAIEQDLQKIHYAKNYYEWLNKVVDLFESNDIFNLIPRKEEEQKEGVHS